MHRGLIRALPWLDARVEPYGTSRNADNDFISLGVVLGRDLCEQVGELLYEVEREHYPVLFMPEHSRLNLLRNPTSLLSGHLTHDSGES